jgi:DnaK suppressor protein
MTNEADNVQTLDAATLAELRGRLEGERARLRAMLPPPGTSATGDQEPPTIDPEDFGDMGQDITIQDTEMALSANEQRMLAQVEHALARMDEGTYGVSEKSGKPIPVERLLALPWATTNVDDPAGP